MSPKTTPMAPSISFGSGSLGPWRSAAGASTILSAVMSCTAVDVVSTRVKILCVLRARPYDSRVSYRALLSTVTETKRT